MEVLQLRRAVAAGVDPTTAFLQMAPAGSTLGQLAAGARNLHSSLQGLDQPLAELLDLPGVTDVLINGPTDVWIDAGAGLEPVASMDLGSPAKVRQMAVRMAAAAGQRLDDATPIVDATLPSGVRLHAVLPPLSGECTVISLRIPAPVAFSLEQLVESGMLTNWTAQILSKLVESQASVLITGATGTGKTTLLASLLGLVSPNQRLICIEEVSELRPNHPHVVHLQARKANVQEAGGVSLSDLVKAALRMRPDRLILGEARGAEVREMLSALNTGHRGGWATVHANSAADVPPRLEALGALAGMSRSALCAQSLAAFEVIVHLRREVIDGQVRRRVAQVAELCRSPQGDLAARSVVDLAADGTASFGAGWLEFSQKFAIAPAEPSSSARLGAKPGATPGSKPHSKPGSKPDAKPADSPATSKDSWRVPSLAAPRLRGEQ